ncbi:DUF58 domain-containing protein [Halovulum sp. GXIMD14793]
MQGIVATLKELVRTRPARGVTGFAPSGRVSTHQWGANRSIFRGRGMEFAESRIYQPGDDVKSIDWRVTARTGQPHTKLFQEERERPVHILVDLRTMMQFGTRVRFKSHLAAEIAAMLAWVGHDGGDRVGGLVLTRSGILDYRATRTRRALLGMLEGFSEQTAPDIDPGQEISLSSGIRRLRRVCRPGTLAFLISDFNDFDDLAAQELRRLARTAHVTNIQITDPLDAALPPNGGRISDGENIMGLGSLSTKDLAFYADQFAARQSRLAQISRQNAMALHFLQTDADPTGILRPSTKREAAA